MKKALQMIIVLVMMIIPVVSLGARTKTYTMSPKEGYVIIDVIVNGVSQGPLTEYTFTNMVGKQNIKIVTRKVGELPANAPVLGVGMTPVNWNGSDWVATTEASWDYNYKTATAGHNSVAGDGTGKWANAKTSDGSMYVWIPRYSYKIESGYHADVDSWSSVDAPGTGKILVKFSNGTADDTSDGYIAHPAFTFGTDELRGIWVAKYEASRNDATEDSVGTGTIVSSKPGVKSWIITSVSNMYEYAYNLNRNLDSHLMKNSEWGAVAYLTNAVGKIPYINNSSDLITGNAGGSQDALEASGVTNAWNTAGGVKASTTHNVYGIYDLSGGAYEYVSAYYTGGDSTYLENDISDKTYAGTLYTNRNTKYVETYATAYDSTKIGDAVYETSSSSSGSTSWDADQSIALNTSYPTFRRGGRYNNTSLTGLFYFNSANGSSHEYSFRAVLAVQQPSSTYYTVTFDANGGSGSMTPQTFSHGVAQNLTSNAFTRDGYAFSGWATTADGAVAYNDGASYTATGDATLYAKWTLNTYTVTFNSNGGTGTMANQTFSHGVAQNLTANAFTRSGRTFKGWSTSSTGSVAYANGASYTATANVTLYARWHCTTCGGDGTVYGTCTSCNGQGGEYSPCGTCGGDGEKGTQTCTGCDGSGWRDCNSCGGSWPDIQDCTRCDGQGGQDCGTCDGTGKEPKECTACDGTGDDSWSRCYSCSGNGKRENTCTTCYGSGVAN